MPNRVIHFEIHASDPEALAKFYTSVFGWEIKKWEEGGDMDYWLIYTGKQEEPGGINGGMMKRTAEKSPSGLSPVSFVCTIVVNSFDEIERKIMDNGGTVAMPKMAITGMAWQGYFLDPDGNIFGVHEPDKSAK